MIDWRTFVVAYGWRARNTWLARVLGQPEEAIRRLRQRGVCRRLPRALDFGELFTRWYGRPPREAEWPAPHACHGTYEWLTPELTLLARLVGTMSVREIAGVLTDRLRQITGDQSAERNRNAVQCRINTIGLQAGGDLLGGLTTREAAQRLGRLALVNQAIHNGQLRTFRVGKRHVIPHQEFERWLSSRDEPPAGWVRLASLREPLGISSDAKLPEYATLGHIPDVVRVRVGTPYGTWYIAPGRARQILEDARAGRPLPWYGKPLPGNQRAMWTKWQARRHRRCRRCVEIWRGPAPGTFEAFCARYGQLSLGEKRHLTSIPGRRKARWRAWGTCRGHRSAGVTVYEAARQLEQPSRWIRGWMRRGLFRWGGLARDPLGGEAVRITPLGLSILRAAAAEEEAQRDCRDWMGVHAAAQLVGVCITTVHHWRALNRVTTRTGARGIEFERASLERQARAYWQKGWGRRWRRAVRPAWLQEQEAA